MSLEDLNMVLGWAADEGWNPGLDDAEAFHAADPQGFLIKEVEGEPVSAISVVNHDPDFSFLGLYLCRPQFRGLGHGMDVWRAGLAHAGTRNIGLDGVPDQQENYARSGFVKHGITVRMSGQITAKPDPRIHLVSPDDRQALIALDEKACGIGRLAFGAAWFSQTPNRQTKALYDGTEIRGFATFRRCRSGTKIGPLYAASQADAQALLTSNPFVGASEIFVDVQGHDSPLAMLLTEQGFNPVFETARMFRGSAPSIAPVKFQAIATMELG